MPGIMIMSLGGSPEPLARSIEVNRPERIVFLASHDSVALAGGVFEPLDITPRAEYEITEDPNKDRLILKMYVNTISYKAFFLELSPFLEDIGPI